MASAESHRLRATFHKSEELSGKSVQVERQEWEAAVSSVSLPPTVHALAADAAGIPGEWIEPTDQQAPAMTILFLHGGGYNAGSSRTHRAFAARLAESNAANVLTIDYRLAPEFPFPAAVEDATRAYCWLLETGVSTDRLVVGGDSAGGGLGIATLVNLRDRGVRLPAAAFVVSPWVDLTLSGPTMRSRADIDPLSSFAGLHAAAQYYLGDRDPAEPLASPLFADLGGLPPLLIQVGDHEVLLSDATRLAEKARRAGVDVHLEIWDEMWHVWHGWADQLPEARDAFKAIVEFLRRHTP